MKNIKKKEKEKEVLVVDYEALKNSPRLRLFQTDKPGQYTFLSYSETENLIANMKSTPLLMDFVLSNKEINEDIFSQFKMQLAAFPNLTLFLDFLYHNNTDEIMLHTKTANLLSLIDALKDKTLTLNYSVDTETFIVNMETLDDLTIKQVLLELDERGSSISPHEKYPLQLVLPNEFKRHFSKKQLMRLIVDDFLLEVPNNKIDTFIRLMQLTAIYERSSATSHTNHETELLSWLSKNIQRDVYVALKTLNYHITKGGDPFLDFLNNKEALFSCLNKIKEYISTTHETTDLLDLIMEVFAQHRLCYFEHTINSSKSYNRYRQSDTENDRKELNDFQREIIKLLSFEKASLQDILSRDSGLYQVEKAQAFWGKIAIYEANENLVDGFFCYGRYLDKRYKKEATYLFENHERNGLYWIRLAKQFFNCRRSHTYLESKDFDSVNPAIQFELAMAREFDPTLKHPEIYELFPANNRMLVGTNYALSRLSNSENDTSYTIGEQCLLRFFKDDMTFPQKKLKILERATQRRSGFIKTVDWFRPEIKEEKKFLTKYYKVPLGNSIIQDILPMLKKFTKISTNSKMDPEQAMENIELNTRIKAFSTLFYEELSNYTKSNILFEAKIGKDHKPIFVVVLLHALLNNGLIHFKLQETELANDIHKTILLLKSKLNKLFSFLDCQSSAISFQEAVQLRINSYIATANVANVAGLELLKSFGGKQEKKEDQSDAYKLSNGAAAIIEGLHFILPLALLFTGVAGLALGTCGLALIGLHKALTVARNVAEKANHALEVAEPRTNIFIAAMHARHFAHEGGLSLHAHDDKKDDHDDASTLKFLNTLFNHALIEDIDGSTMLMRDWFAIYEPVIEQLHKKSTVALGHLLVELLLRGLAARLISQKNNKSELNLPKKLPELLDYFNETLWEYTFFTITDDILLSTKKNQSIFALDLIFPNRLNAKMSGEIVTMEINSRANREIQEYNQVRTYFQSEDNLNLTRFASSYEIRMMNRSNDNAYRSLPLELSEQSKVLIRQYANTILYTGYNKAHTINSKLESLGERFQLMKLFQKAHSLKIMIEEMPEDISENFIDTKGKKKQILNKLPAKNLMIKEANALIMATTRLSENCDTPEEKSNFLLELYNIVPTLAKDLPIEVALCKHIEIRIASLIFFGREMKIIPPSMRLHQLFSAENAVLEQLAKQEFNIPEGPLKLESDAISYVAKKGTLAFFEPQQDLEAFPEEQYNSGAGECSSGTSYNY